jgi:hypothetical protein
MRCGTGLLIGLALGCSPLVLHADEPPPLLVGLAEADISPKVGDKPVYMAGFGQNRKATKVHDPLMARVVVLKHGESKIALASIDVIGFFNHHVAGVREQLPGFRYVLVSSTHNHEGPDTLGLWGPNPFTTGVDGDYIKLVQAQIVKAVQDADKAAAAATVEIGAVTAPELLRDSREPQVKHDELIVLRFLNAKTKEPVGLLVQWNCHPETLDRKNTEISADFVGYTVKHLQEKHKCPVAYFTGTVGGLMTSLGVEVKDDQGKALNDGTFEKTERYGHFIGELADKALASARPVSLTPFEVLRRDVFVPMDNKIYQVGRQLGVLQREAFVWGDDPYKAEPAGAKDTDKRLAIKTEIGWLKLGDLEAALIPGEIYPELVLDKIQDPVDPGADFPDAPKEPAIYPQLRAKYRMMIGLANDEIGYIIPKRQWDEKPPFCYGLKKAQYGEMNSVGPETAPILCKAFQELVGGKK